MIQYESSSEHNTLQRQHGNAHTLSAYLFSIYTANKDENERWKLTV